MQSYVIKVTDKLFATNADDVMDAEEKFLDEYPDYEDEDIKIYEINTIDEVGELVEVF